MKRKKMNILMMGVGTITLIVVAMVAFVYHKPHRSVERLQAQYELTAQELQSIYSTDEDKANQLFLDEIIRVQGELSTVEKNDLGETVLVIKTGSTMSAVRCTMTQGQHDLSGLQPGDQVAVKGICTGMLLDIILTKGILLID